MKEALSRFSKILANLIIAATVLSESLTNANASGFDAWIDGYTHSMVVQPDAKVIVGGTYSAVNGSAKKGLVRLNSDGSLDVSFNPHVDQGLNSDYGVFALAIQSDGKILAGGNFTNMNGIACKGLARINDDGTSDTNFVSPVASAARIILQSDGKMIVIGRISTSAYPNHPTFGRVMPDGAMDGSFMANIPNVFAQGGIGAIALQGDGKILVGGNFQIATNSSQTVTTLRRLNDDGSLDATFNPIISLVSIFSIGVQPNGRIVAGVMVDIDGTYKYQLLGLYPDGTIDTNFSTVISHYLMLAAIQPDGKLLAFSSPDPSGANALLIRLNADGSVDPTFQSSSSYYSSIAIQPDGKIVVRHGEELVRLNADGTPDPLFQLRGVSLKSDGGLQFGVDRPEVTNFTVLVTDQIIPGNTLWTKLGSPTPQGSNIFGFRDPSVTNSTTRFYWIIPRLLTP